MAVVTTFFRLMALNCAVWSTQAGKEGPKPNIMFLLTDDQDLILGGLKPMPQLRKLLAEEGTTFSNAFVHTPICCPSRSSYLSGRYLHNSLTFQNGAGDGCANASWSAVPEKDTYAVHAQNAGYRTSYAGKYLNAYGLVGSTDCAVKTDKGCNRVPPGWTDWHGLVGNSRYYNASIIDNGVRTDYGDDTTTDYAPDLFFARTKAFLQDHLAYHKNTPFLAVLATPSCHGPFTPADKYIGHFANETAPRTPNYNHSNEDKQWMMRQLDPITDSMAVGIDHMHNSRWETLLSVDDYIGEIVAMLESGGVMDNTFFLFTSDHGFQLGNHRLPGDKRHLYEHDIRIPFVLRGPGVPANVTNQHVVLNVDVAPTFVDFATGSVPDTMDGRSFRSVLTSPNGGDAMWRKDFMVDYHGGFRRPCMLQSCPAPKPGNFHEIDCANNTYACVRTLVHANTTVGDTAVVDSNIYCEFADNENFIEYYELIADPYQLVNARHTASPVVLSTLKQRLQALRLCKGIECRSL